jgi:hypothetical protein
MQQLMCKCNDHIFSAEIYEYCREAFCSTRRTSANHSVDRGSNSASVHFGGSNSASVHFGGSAGYDLSGSGCQITSSTSEPQFTFMFGGSAGYALSGSGCKTSSSTSTSEPQSSIRLSVLHVLHLRTSIASLTTYHLRQIYASTVALKTALKIVPLNYRCAKMNTPHFKHSTGAGGLHRLRTRMNKLELYITIQLYRFIY